ncbi:MAG: hypothetical protein HY520_00020 [Candidatus Aenigmarchaeota archaeon]|nr:hypothetical protein [Candidatus Aenigmarchaeota archaeon]
MAHQQIGVKLDGRTFYQVSREMGDEVAGRYPGSGFLYLPMQTGGLTVGRPFEESLRQHARVVTYPVTRNRRRRAITSPTEEEVCEGADELRKEGGVVAVGFDDIVSTGRDLMLLYRQLRRWEKVVGFDHLILAAGFDMQGITDYAAVRLYTETQDREAFLQSLEAGTLAPEDYGTLWRGVEQAAVKVWRRISGPPEPRAERDYYRLLLSLDEEGTDAT